MNRVGGIEHGGGPFRLHVAKVKVPLTAVLAAWVGSKLAAALVWLVRHPVVFAPVVLLWLLAAVTDALGAVPLVLLMVALIAGLLVWRRRNPESFTRHVVWRFRGLWRGRWTYRFAWQPAMVTTGLAVSLGSREYLPKIRTVRSTGTVDRVRVRMLPGQTLEDWAGAAPRLAQTFNAQECRVRSIQGSRQELLLWFLVHDPLTHPIDPMAVQGSVDFTALPIARREDGLDYRLRLLGTHLLIVGATGSGKGSVIWSLIHALQPAIREKTVEVWALDPKGGMELAPGRALFTRFVYGDPDDNPAHNPADGGAAYELDFARVLEDAVTVMRRRQAALRGVTRQHTPSVEEPLVVVVVDELASLTAYVQDREAKKRIAAALSLLMSQGRAVGVTLVGAVQDPRKEVVSVRDLFPTRIALRLTEPEHVGLVLGSGARDRGARCDQIPESLPGVGYVALDGVSEPVRVRFSHITDPHIDHLVAEHTSSADVVRPVAALEESAPSRQGVEVA